MKLSEMQNDGIWVPQHICVFGESKAGKTQLAGQLAERFNLYWFDLENGWRTLLKMPKEWQERVTLFRIPDSRSYPVGIETMRKVVTGAPMNLCVHHGRHNCGLCEKSKAAFHPRFCLHELGQNDIFIVDSGTQLGNSAINHIIRNQDEEYKPGWEDYRKQGTLLDGFYSNIQQGAYNVVVLCLVTTARMEDNDKTRLVPVSGTDNFSRGIAKYFDHIVYCEAGLGQHNFASSTTFKQQILIGSRTDQAIEKFQTPKLLPFFTGEIPPLKKDPVADVMAALKGSAAKAVGLSQQEEKL